MTTTREKSCKSEVKLFARLSPMLSPAREPRSWLRAIRMRIAYVVVGFGLKRTAVGAHPMLSGGLKLNVTL